MTVANTAQPLAIRDCYSVDANGGVAVVDCMELHDGQVFTVDTPLYGVEPGERDATVWSAAATETCQTDFATFVQDETIYAIGTVITSPVGEAPLVDCTVVSAAATGTDDQGLPSYKWSGTAEDIVGSYAGIEVGECFEFPTGGKRAAELPCDSPHDAEMFVVDASVGLNDVLEPYPSDEKWSDLAGPLCDEPFLQYTGLTSWDDTKGLNYTILYPVESSWMNLELRSLSCAIVADDDSKLVGSKKG